MLTAFWTWVVNLVSNGALDKVEKIVADYLGAKTDSDKTQAALAAQEIAGRIAITQAEISSRILAWPRFVFEMVAALYWAETVLVDKIAAPWFGFQHSTDPITGQMSIVYTLIVSAMFGERIADRVVSKLTGR